MWLLFWVFVACLFTCWDCNDLSGECVKADVQDVLLVFPSLYFFQLWVSWSVGLGEVIRSSCEPENCGIEKERLVFL